jgi:hypothetical protein
MKIDLAKTIRDYFEGCISSRDLEECILGHKEITLTTNKTRGRSVYLPSGEALNGMKIGVSETYKIHRDLCKGLISKNTCLFVIDMLTLNDELLIEDEGFNVLDNLGSKSSSEDLEIWMRSSNCQE